MLWATTIRKAVRERPAFVLFIIGFAIVCFATFVFHLANVAEWMSEPYRTILTIVANAVIVAVGMATWTVTVALLKLHGRLASWFERSVEIGYSPRKIQARVLISVLLGLSYWIVIYFGSWQGILKYVPLANVLETTIPNNFQEFLSNPWWLFSTVFLFGPLGPVTIYALTWFRFEKGKETGRTTIRILELICYLSWVLFFLSAALHFDSTRFVLFANIYFVIILPSTFGCNALILWGEAPLSSLTHQIWSLPIESEQGSMLNETWLVTRVYFNKPLMQPDSEQLTRDQNQVILAFIKPHSESIHHWRVRTWHFFREQEGTPENLGRPYLLMRICGERDYLCSSLKPVFENDLHRLQGSYGVIDYTVNEEPNYTEEAGYGKDGWPIAQRVFEQTAKASVFLLDYRSRNARMPRDFDEDKFVHCFLNQSRAGYDKEIGFYIKRLRDLGVNIELKK